jgi:hypothetical protein
MIARVLFYQCSPYCYYSVGSDCSSDCTASDCYSLSPRCTVGFRETEWAQTVHPVGSDRNYSMGSDCNYSVGSDCDYSVGSDCDYSMGSDCNYSVGSDCYSLSPRCTVGSDGMVQI